MRGGDPDPGGGVLRPEGDREAQARPARSGAASSARRAGGPTPRRGRGASAPLRAGGGLPDRGGPADAEDPRPDDPRRAQELGASDDSLPGEPRGGPRVGGAGPG